MDVFGHASYVLYLLSYLVRDMLYLRALTVVAGVLLLLFYFTQRDILWVPVFWISVFTVVNGCQIAVLLMDRKPIGLSDEEKQLYYQTFSSMTAGQFRKLLKLGGWGNAEADEVLVRAGSVPDALMVLSSGRLNVHVEGLLPIALREGQFIGELAFVSGEVASANVVTAGPARYFAWPSAALRRHVDQGSEMGVAIQSTLGMDIASKLRETTLRLRR